MKPAMKTINGKQCVRLIDLAHAWDTTTSNILCTSKPYHIPEKYLHRIDGRIWCELEGLRYRSTATSKSRLTRHICEFLDSLGKPTEPEPTETRMAKLIADAHQLAADAFLKSSDNSEKFRELDDTAWNTRELANGNSNRLDKLEYTVNKLKSRDHAAQSASATVANEENTGRIQELSGKLDNLAETLRHNLNNTIDNAAAVHITKDIANKALDTATQAADLAQENADIVSGEIERLTEQKERIDKLEKLSDENAVSVAASVTEIKRNQRDNAARIGTIEKQARAVDWILATVAILSVVGHVLRLLRRR